jgi:putative ABC transport system ATP-binding protein
MAEPIITVEKLRVIYNQGKSNEVRSLDGVDVKIYPEEYVIIYGPSGCGKSTLLYSIAGLQMPTYGEVTINGKNLSKMTKKEKVELHQTGIGMVFQAFYLIDSLNVIDNVCLPKTFRGEDVKKRRTEGMSLLQRFSILEQSNKLPSQLSGGQKQRVSIARSLINNPNIILADEPVGNLDSESAENVLKILKELNDIDKKTIILVTHNPEHLHFADRIIHMKDGLVVKEEVIRDKRPEEAVSREKEGEGGEAVELSNELKLLLRTFKNLTPAQMGMLMIPFKAKQLLFHITSELSEEQLNVAENLVKEVLFNNLDTPQLAQKLDLKFEQGGANWNRTRANSFTDRVKETLTQVEVIKNNSTEAPKKIAEYLEHRFKMNLDEKAEVRLQALLKLRMENKIDLLGLEKKLDDSVADGGVGLYKQTVEKVAREVEILMLLKYTG